MEAPPSARFNPLVVSAGEIEIISSEREWDVIGTETSSSVQKLELTEVTSRDRRLE